MILMRSEILIFSLTASIWLSVINLALSRSLLTVRVLGVRLHRRPDVAVYVLAEVPSPLSVRVT